jgi:hypothetical protein
LCDKPKYFFIVYLLVFIEKIDLGFYVFF